MPLSKDEAIVIRRIDHSETSQVLVFFGRDHGQIRLIAKGIKRGTKKAFAAGLDLLEMGSVTFSGGEARSGLGTLTEWRQVDPFLGLRLDARRLYAAQYAAEITSQLTEQGDPHPDLYEAFVELLRSVSGGAESLPGVVAFQLALLSSVGLLPIFEGCAACERPSTHVEYFSAGQGGMICRDCEPAIVEKRRVSAGLAAALANAEVPGDLARQAFAVLEYAISYAMGRPSRLAQYVTM